MVDKKQWMTIVFIGHQMNVLRVLRGTSCRRSVSVVGTTMAATASAVFVVVRSFVRSAFNPLPWVSYLGFMRHRSSYNIRKKLFSSEYYKSIKNYLIPCDHYSMVVIKSD